MPFDLGDDTARLCPTSSLIGEVRVGAPDVKGGAADRTLEKIADAFLQDVVGGQPDGVFDPFAFEVLIDLGIGEPGVGPEMDARDLAAIARHDRLQDAFPAVGAVHVAGPQGAAFQIAILVENEQRMIAGAVIVTVPDTVFLFAMRRAHARIHVEQETSRRTATMNAVDPFAGEISERRKVLFRREPARRSSLYTNKTGLDDVHAARLYGNLVCRVGIIRPERWWCFPEPVADDRFSRTYVLQSRISLSFIADCRSRDLRGP